MTDHHCLRTIRRDAVSSTGGGLRDRGQTGRLWATLLTSWMLLSGCGDPGEGGAAASVRARASAETIGPELLGDPDLPRFSVYLSGAGDPDPASVGASSEASLGASSRQVHSGSVMNPGGNYGGARRSDIPAASMASGQTYQLSYSARSLSGPVILRMSNQSGSGDENSISHRVPVGEAWARYTRTARLSGTGNDVPKTWLYTWAIDPEQTVLIDDVRLQEVSADTPLGTVVPPGVELLVDPDLPPFLVYLSGAGDPDPASVSASNEASRGTSSRQVHSGSVLNPGGSYGGARRNELPVSLMASGRTYQLSYSARSLSGPVTLHISNQSGGGDENTLSHEVALGSDWVRFTRTARLTGIGANVPKGQLYARTLGPQQSFLIDRVTLKEVPADSPLGTVSQPVGGAGQTLSFSGYTWSVRTTDGDPGPPQSNCFSSSGENVWIDAAGQLHLKISYAGGHWSAAEIVSEQSLGYGTYQFTLGSAVGDLDRQAVLGLFTYLDDTHEIDIEFAKWGVEDEINTAQYSCQPGDVAGNSSGWPMSADSESVHSFTWSSGSISYLSQTAATPPAEISHWTYAGSSVPVPSDEKTHINLWLASGLPPADGQPIEVVIKRFEFIPPT